MSKAFTREDGAGESGVVRPPVRLGPGEARYITPEGYARKQRELQELEATPNPSADVKAKAKGLRSLLDVLTVAEPHADLSHAAFGTWVELEDEDGQHLTYRLVGPDEVDVRAGEISVESPIARALIGRAVGDSVVVRLPRGWREFTLMEVHANPPPERQPTRH